MPVEERERGTRREVRIFRALIVVLTLVLILRLFWMQVIEHPVFLGRAASNKIKTIPRIAPRGRVFDRAGRSLAVNEPVFSLMYFPPLGDEEDENLPDIAGYLGVPIGGMRERIEREKKRNYPYQPVSLYDMLTLEEVTFFSESKSKFPGVFVEENNYVRKYPFGAATAHVVGYTGLLSEDDPRFLIEFGYERDEFVGKSGVEKSLDETYIHGKSGARKIEISKDRFFKREISNDPSKNGTDIYLTIDAVIQDSIYKLMKRRRGAVIVSKPKTGEIIAILSSPSFDPNRLHSSENAEYIEKVFTDDVGLPLFFRPIQGEYAPGSTYKLVTALAGLETGKVTENMQWTCLGKYELGNRVLREEFQPYGHGPIVFKDAIGKSCDVAFWIIGVSVGAEKIGKYARLLGFGEQLGIDLSGEEGGRVPDREYKLENWKEEWYLGDTANMAIGQGFVSATPLQVLWSVNAIVTDGVVFPPRLIKAVEIDGEVKEEPWPEPRNLGVSPDNTRIIREGMRRSVLYGTSRNLKNIGVQVAGKTGTADVPHGKEPHGWFVGFFPYGDPEYSIVVLLENSGLARDSAVPLAGEIIKFIAKTTGVK